MATTFQKKVVENNLRSLQEIMQLFHSAIDDTINKVLVDGKNWLSQGTSTETTQSYDEIMQVIDSTKSFLKETFQRIDVTVDNMEEVVKAKVPGGPETRKSSKSSKGSAEMADIKSLTTQMKAMEKKMSSFTHSVQELTSRQDLVESCVKDMSSKYAQLEDDVNTKFDHIDRRVKEITTQMNNVVSKHTDRVDDIEKKLNSLQEAQQTLSLSFTNDNLKHDQNAIETMGTDITKLKECIQDLEDREVDIKTRVEQVTETVQNLTSDLSAMKTQDLGEAVAFTAHIPSDYKDPRLLFYKPVKDKIISGYEKVIGNKDQSFCSDTGIFTAPVKGMYAVCLRQWQVDSGRIEMGVIKSKQNDDSAATVSVITEEVICETWTRGDGQSDFCLQVTELGEGDTLYVKAWRVTENARLVNVVSSFSCFHMK